MSMQMWAVAAILCACAVWIVRRLVRRKGNDSCGCNCGCTDCPLGDSCKKKKS